MKKLLPICLSLAALLLMTGCTGGEDNAVKEAPADVQTKSATEMGGGRQKTGEGAAMPTGGERDRRAGG